MGKAKLSEELEDEVLVLASEMMKILVKFLQSDKEAVHTLRSF